jgi:hypothetical protein
MLLLGGGITLKQQPWLEYVLLIVYLGIIAVLCWLMLIAYP